MSKCLLYVSECPKNKLPILLDLSLWCAHAQYMSDEEIKGQGSAGGFGGEVLREGRHPELGLQGGFQTLGQACPQGAE